ncbi:transaldolase [Cellulomonas chengniuliangii]|uniref:Transaldolase n=1 Tax=Cellulomonas chengniuliangii TaxID=2968084 RepID=A0ABY5L1J4_9CELL|nr:transaldolase [Cellulomonas chengniuliangii]MCC2308273.1 transaldolase [Cellulomonas chengniuliangii]MCC2317281.1 transaldolase [Cellulomonas chengniuliangii]UUI76662.1 transaldolase [Cellulomonas chengniuliangii]
MTETTGNPLDRLTGAGVAVWLDDLSRELLRRGDLAQLVADLDVVGVTTNPTIFASALAKGDAYDAQLSELASAGADVDAAVFAITTDDVREAADVLRPVYDATDTVDGRVSIEVDPRLAHDTRGTIDSAKALWAAVDRPNVFIKIPATLEGLPAITAVLGEGISVNVTLIFSLERYAAVMDAFLEGLEKARDNGYDLRTIGSVASFFVSRVDAAIDPRLDALGTPEAAALRGKAAIANARLAFGLYEEVVAGDRWQGVAEHGAHPQRPLWASTGVKDPAYRDTVYVEELVAEGTVNTMPSSTLHAFADHGVVRGDTVAGTQQESARVVADLAALGIDLDEVTRDLEVEGLQKFEKSWDDLLSTVSAGLAQVAR